MNRDEMGAFALKMQRLIYELARDYELCDKKCLARYGVTAAQGTALLSIPEESHLSMNELSEIMGLANSTMTTTVDHLVGKGLAYRRQDYEDRRVVRIGLTDQGRYVRGALEKEKQELLQEVFAEIHESDRATILRSLGQVTRLIRGALEKSCCGK